MLINQLVTMKYPPFNATKYVAVNTTRMIVRDKRRNVVDWLRGAKRHAAETRCRTSTEIPHSRKHLRKALADAMSKDHGRSLRSRVFNDLWIALENM